ncbi:hypothetical protein [Bdellovibrio reynosensis]|uniref:Outer membrane protein beta-barrel domain-containing protein n=1 Tax=Bdellovibrio reynosensis TaxID=2835041 RepID=A0ABY4C5I9_9BACT|nr:hypothetical protein [Bdellovibrio reynosensis]UOF00202.1 hypothetical protein MNR06_10860 [Bdellovibrio reynosensis]
MLRSMVIASLLLSAVAQAAPEEGSSHGPTTYQSEFFFQSPAGHSDITPKIGYTAATTEEENATDETTSSGYSLGVAYEYGINEMWAVEFGINYATAEYETGAVKTKNTGIMNPELLFKGTSAMGWGSLHYGVLAEFAIENAKAASASDDGNLSTGGHALMPYVGAAMGVGTGILGGRLSYEYKLDRTLEDAAGNEVTIKDGHELGLAVFYEQMMADVLLGAAITQFSEAAINDEDGNELEESGSMTRLSLYSRIPMETWSLIPRFDYDLSKSHHDKYNVMLFTVAARIPL